MPPINPLSTLTNDELWNLQWALQVMCGRGKFSFRKGRQRILCGGVGALKLEADLRGLPTPAAPYHVSQLKPFSL